MSTGLTRQQKKRIGRESIRNPQYGTYSGMSRFARKHEGETKFDVVNTRGRTIGRNVKFQCIYDVLDTNGKKILSFGNNGPLNNNVLPKKITDKVAKKCSSVDKETKERIWKRRVGNIVLINTVKHIVPTNNMVRIQKLILSTIKTK